MESVLLKLEIKLAGQRGKLEDFLKSAEAKSSSQKSAQKVIHAMAFVKDDSEFSKIYTPMNK